MEQITNRNGIWKPLLFTLAFLLLSRNQTLQMPGPQLLPSKTKTPRWAITLFLVTSSRKYSIMENLDMSSQVNLSLGKGYKLKCNGYEEMLSTHFPRLCCSALPVIGTQSWCNSVNVVKVKWLFWSLRCINTWAGVYAS